jgi:hypothetical protein
MGLSPGRPAPMPCPTAVSFTRPWRAQARLEEGIAVEGKARGSRGEQRLGQNGPQIDLFDAPIAALPPKTAG